MKLQLRSKALVLLAGVFATLGWIVPRAPGGIQQQEESVRLAPNQRIEAEIRGSQQHRYVVELAAGDYFHAVIEQHGIDVTVELLGPDGSRVADSDRDTGASGPEPIYWVAERTGPHLLKISPLYPNAVLGRYLLEIREWRKSVPLDQRRVAGALAFMDAYRLYTKYAPDKALEKYEEALEHWRATDELERQAESVDAILLCLASLGEGSGQVDYAEESVRLHGILGQRAELAEAYMQLGTIYNIRGDAHRALEVWHRALEIRRAIGEAGWTLNRMGDLYLGLGEFQTALDHYREALSLSPKAEPSVRTDSLSSIANVYIRLGDKSAAIDLLTEALEIWHSRKQPRREGLALRDLGVCQAAFGDYEAALDDFARAMALFPPKAFGWIAGTMRQEAAAYEALGDKRRALEIYEQMLALTGEGRTQSLIGAAKLYSSFGDFEKALNYLMEALESCRKAGSWAGEAEVLRAMADVEISRNHLDEARTKMDSALQIIESVRARIVRADLRASYFASTRRFYESEMRLLLKSYQENPGRGFEIAAYNTGERARARSLLDLLAESGADVRRNVDPALALRERQVRGEINATEQHRMALASDSRKTALIAKNELKVRSLLLEYQEIEAQIASSSPRYAALTQPQPVTVPEVQQLLDPDTLLLEFFIADAGSFLWAISPSSVEMHALPPRSEIESAARRVYSLLTARQRHAGEIAPQRQVRLKQSAAEYPLAAHALARMLFGSISSRLSVKRLIIVPDGALHYLPFSALPVPGDTDTIDHDRPLIEDHEVVILPSASTLAVLRKSYGKRQVPRATVAVFADPVFDRKDPRLRRSDHALSPSHPIPIKEELKSGFRDAGVIIEGGEIPRLPFTRAEAEAILSNTSPAHSLKALDFNASRAALLQDGLVNYRILHFATHGLVDNRLPELSGLILSLVDRHGALQDGYFRLTDIYGLRLSADLVVLSACGTALGKEIAGEGLVGLTRGFMYAGAARVMASLWQVDDESTAELMKLFYHNALNEKMPYASALRRAQLEIQQRPRWHDPYFWAGFILQGDW